MKKILLVLAFTTTANLAFATDQTITIGASSVPHAEMLRFVQPMLAKEGIKLKISEFSDYVTPNIAVIQKQLDANFFQSKPYFIQYNKDHGSNLVDLVDVHLEPMGVYANSSEVKFIKTKKATDLNPHTKIAVPNDASNEERALELLQTNGFIKLKAGVKLPTKKDIIANPYGVTIVELDPAMLPRALSSKQVDLAVINSNIALQAGLNPLKNSVLIEQKNAKYANLVAVRPDEVNEPKMKALVKALTSPQLKEFIAQKYQGAVIPLF
jgi:D-methionine transport system substrate-binding protein